MTPEHWVEASHRLERALTISASVKSERDRVVPKIVDEINRKRVDTGYFSAKMMQALQDHRLGDASTMAIVAEETARAAFAKKDWDRAREYFALLAQWHKKLGDSVNEQQARRNAANCYVEQAATAHALADRFSRTSTTSSDRHTITSPWPAGTMGTSMVREVPRTETCADFLI